MSKIYKVSLEEELRLKKELEARNDVEAGRIKHYLAMPDLSREPESPLFAIVEKSKKTRVLEDFDEIVIPKIVPTSVSFDLFNFAPNHPARSKSDTYYVDEENILRTHDTVMWYYYLNRPEIKKQIEEGKSLGVICYGTVYRKDEIDRRHMNIFHQMGGLHLQPDSEGIMPIEKLKIVLKEIVESLFPGVKYRFLDDIFPYTDPSLQIEVEINNEWVEIMGGGMPRKEVLKNFGVEGYNGWAFGFGLERLAIISMELPDIRLLWSEDPRVKKQLVLGKKYKEVSKYPAVTRDISFVVNDSAFAPNNYFDLVRDIVGDLVEEMSLIDSYENEERFGKGNKSYAYRIVYRSIDRTLTSTEVDKLHKSLEEATSNTYKATIR